MHNKRDLFAKRIFTEVYDEFGTLYPEQNVSLLDAQRMDMWYEPNQDLPPEESLPSFLRLPLRMGRRAAHFEFESGLPDSIAMRKIVRKQLTWDEHRRQEAEGREQPVPPLFPTWVILPGKPRGYFERRRVRPAEGWPPGFYETDSESELWFVVTSELPRTRETLVLRLLGNEKCRDEAMEDLQRIPEDDPEYSERLETMAELLRAVEYDKEIPELERTLFMTAARADHIRYTEEIRGEGESKGRTEEARMAIYDLCEALNVPVPAPRRQQVDKMSLDELRALRQHLKKHQSWPSEN